MVIFAAERQPDAAAGPREQAQKAETAAGSGAVTGEATIHYTICGGDAFSTATSSDAASSERGQDAPYLFHFRQQREDVTHNIPCSRIESFPRSGNEGLYGWTTIPSDGRIHRREDLIGTWQGYVTDIHESIHTPDEYETRRLVEWVLEPLGGATDKYRKRLTYRR